MKSLALPILCCLAAGLSAQPLTPAGVFQSPVSQVNTLPSCIIVSARATAPGSQSSPLLTATGLFTPSATFAYECQGGASFGQPGVLDLFCAVEGGVSRPFILAVSLQPGSLPCGGPANLPCMTGPSLFSSIPTTLGVYHLDFTPFFLIDGLGLGTGAPPADLGPFGSFSFYAPVPVDTADNGGVERRFAIQAAVIDPSSPVGITLSACFNCDQWVHQP